MSLSDEVLARPGGLAAIRHLLQQLVSDLGARSAFLVDERGVPFAALGSVEFRYPHPLSALAGGPGGSSLLAALLGERRRAAASDLLVRRAGSRALLAIVLETPPAGRRRRAAVARVKRAAVKLAPLLEEGGRKAF